jgi:hypothetical protein
VSGRPKGSRGGAGDGSASPDHGRGDGASRSRPAGVANVAQAHEITAGTARAGRAGSAGGTTIRDAGSYGEFRLDFPRGSDFVGAGYSQRAAEAYRRIRNNPEDTPLVAANMGIDPRIVEGMRQNLFVQQHNIALGPNRVERGYFTPDDDIADQWEGAVRGTLDPDQVGEFRNLAAHEYVENRLMEAGLPYRSSHPASYDADGDHMPHPWRTRVGPTRMAAGVSS